MKNISFLLILLTAASLASCAVRSKKDTVCHEIEVRYISKTKNIYGNPVGIFSIKNNSPSRVNFAYAESFMLTLHPKFLKTMQRQHAADQWRTFNILLDEYSVPTGSISVEQGGELTFIYDANGLFIEGQSSPQTEYSIFVRSDSACEYQSEPFRL